MTDYPLVLVTWKDHASSDDWLTPEEAGRLVALATVWTVGWLYKETEEAYWLSGTISEDHTFCGVITIAKGTVVSKEEIQCRSREEKASTLPAQSTG